jgi:signal peptidase II
MITTPDVQLMQKVTILPFFALTLVHNMGISFGLMESSGIGRWLLVLFSLAVSGFLFDWLRKSDTPLMAWGLGLIIGGAVGNAIDRLRFGYVVDFLDFSGLHFPWVFNVADAGISVGVAILLWYFLKTEQKGEAAQEHE